MNESIEYLQTILNENIRCNKANSWHGQAGLELGQLSCKHMRISIVLGPGWPGPGPGQPSSKQGLSFIIYVHI